MTRRAAAALQTITTAACLSALLLAATACEDSAARDAAATAAASQWLGLVDANQYGASWDTSAELFQRSIGRAQWEDSLMQVRQPLGAVVSRNISQIEHLTEVPNAPKGSYITIHYETSFDNRPGTIERVSAAEMASGWKISGYFIQ